jgi:spermidine synthase
MFWDNLYLLAGSQALPDLERQAHLPLLLHPAPTEVGFIGLGTGITAGGALRHHAVESVTAVELSALVADAAARHFGAFNQGICGHPRARVYVEDAGPYFAAAKGRFDVIVGDLFTPWRPGEARLCSLEHFQAAKEALAPGGVFCQWLAMSQLTEEGFRTIALTFKRVFPKVHLFRNHLKTGSVPLALVGFKDGELDWDTVSLRCAAERQRGRLLDPLCRHPEGLALLYLGTWEAEDPPQGRLNTLGNLEVELGAARHVLAGNPADYFHGDSDRWLALLQQQLQGIGNRAEMPDSLRRFPKAGLLATRWEIAAERGDPSASALHRMLLAEISQAILTDSAADWSFWAGRKLR